MDYHQKIELYFELKGTPDSSRESYRRRMKAFVSFMEKQNKRLSDTTEEDIQQYILFLKQVKGLTPGTINNYISSIKFFYTYVLEKEWNPNKLPRMKRIKKFPVVPPREDVLRLLNSCRNIKHKAIFYLI
ncbi:tyrosine-type recombinase/integrase, partial [Rossellomorea vietnamensis]|uniref:tyrosine-type recombinase/integrase n=1 Tax=Rossellomorea vietnamensis TaxID=218284 RepID=UPI001E2FB9ED